MNKRNVKKTEKRMRANNLELLRAEMKTRLAEVLTLKGEEYERLILTDGMVNNDRRTQHKYSIGRDGRVFNMLTGNDVRLFPNFIKMIIRACDDSTIKKYKPAGMISKDGMCSDLPLVYINVMSFRHLAIQRIWHCLCDRMDNNIWSMLHEHEVVIWKLTNPNEKDPAKKEWIEDRVIDLASSSITLAAQLSTHYTKAELIDMTHEMSDVIYAPRADYKVEMRRKSLEKVKGTKEDLRDVLFG